MNEKDFKSIRNDSMIIAKGCYYDMDCHKTLVNNNVLVVGASGSGKTRSVVTPNLLQATGSYIISDPKGNLYSKYHKYLKEKGYKVTCIDFTNPAISPCHYNPLEYSLDSQDAMKLAHYIMEPEKESKDPIWNEMAQVVVQACIAALLECAPRDEITLQNMVALLDATYVHGDPCYENSEADVLFNMLEKIDPRSYAVCQYKKFRLACNETLRSIQAVVNSRIGQLSSPEIFELTKCTDIDFMSIGQEKTALFVICSDTDRSMDFLVNLFYSQAMTELCGFADKKCRDNALPVPVRFIMDDFATNCLIEDFPRMISSIRSRNISTMLMIQAESQLEEGYGKDGRTIIANCDTYLYLGGNDFETARAVSQRANVPLQKILSMPVGTNWIFRRGQLPINGTNFETGDYLKYKLNTGGDNLESIAKHDGFAAKAV